MCRTNCEGSKTGIGREKMKIDQAVRLQKLWNSSFEMNLRTREAGINNYILYVLKEEISVASLEILRRLTSAIDLELNEQILDYSIDNNITGKRSERLRQIVL